MQCADRFRIERLDWQETTTDDTDVTYSGVLMVRPTKVLAKRDLRAIHVVGAWCNVKGPNGARRAVRQRLPRLSLKRLESRSKPRQV